MNPIRILGFAILAVLPLAGLAAPAPRLQLDLRERQGELRLEHPPVPPIGGMRFEFHTEASADLLNWEPIGALRETGTGAMALPLPDNSPTPSRFFRLKSELVDTGSEATGEELFGYERVFKEQLGRIGYISVQEFSNRYSREFGFLDGVNWDVTSAKFWPEFNADPAVINAGFPPDSLDRRLYDFRLNPDEDSALKKNGFVVSERLGSYSFADVFYKLFSDDMPVFISADSALQAWHYSFQRMLEELEETHLAPRLGEVLDGMSSKLPEVWTQAGHGPLRDNLLDADYFLAVARSLLLGQPQRSMLPDPDVASVQSARINQTLAAVQGLAFVLDFPLWGTNRMVDFSQFTIRGHYERSVNLGRYFQAFMWTARADLRVFAGQATAQSLRELGTAVVLNHLLEAGGQFANWNQVDALLRAFIGRADSMTFTELAPLLWSAGVRSPADVTSLDVLARVQNDIVTGRRGVQFIAGDAYVSPFSTQQTLLPRSFTMTGQRFVPDGWAIHSVIFDRIRWNEEIPGKTFFGKVIRRYASALDVAFGVFGNEQIVPELAARMTTEQGMAFRDGLPYQHNLAAVKETFDQVTSVGWENSIYTRWLWALRALSGPTTGAEYPQAMRTRAWAMKNLNTQLASWTQLKHDTVLYAKQPYSGMMLCEYPAGFVEPRLEFWKRMEALAQSTADVLEEHATSGTIQVFPREPGFGPGAIPVDLAQRHAARVSHCRNFAERMATLAEMARKELAQEPFTDGEVAFIRSLMNRRETYYGKQFDGWYPRLFYDDYSVWIDPWPGGRNDSGQGSDKFDALVTDVQTAPPDEVDPNGGILHEAVGNVDLLMIAVDNGPDRMLYAGPVLSHYEQLVPGPTLKRMTDSEWKGIVQWDRKNLWPRPEWTRGYLVPKPNP